MKPGAGADPIKTCKIVKSITIVMRVAKNIILQLKYSRCPLFRDIKTGS